MDLFEVKRYPSGHMKTSKLAGYHAPETAPEAAGPFDW